jgi:hypothetical protein
MKVFVSALVRLIPLTRFAAEEEAIMQKLFPIITQHRWPDDMPVPGVGLGLKCSRCGGKDIKTIPD